MSELTPNDTENTLQELIKSLVSVIGDKDPYMKRHADRVATNCVRFSKQIGFSQVEINQIYLAGLLHDIGIVYIPLEITQKPGKLTDNEMNLVKKHPLISEKIVSKHNILKGILPIIRHHHESFDGSGYPDGLKGDEIPKSARILNLVNSYDAMTSACAHRPSLSIEEALEEIKKNEGKQFDGELIDDFITHIKSYETAFIEIKEEKGKEEIEEEREVKKEEETADKENIEETPGKEEVEEVAIGTVKEITQKIIKQAKKGEIDLPVLPKVVQEIQKAMSRPNATVNNLGEAIEKDAVISVRLISVANSPMYRGTEKILTVKQAIPRLGIKETQSIVSTIANKNLYETKNREFRTLLEKLWLHSLASAYGAKALASKLVLGDLEKFFFMGLIHDIGKVLLFKVLGENSSQLDMDDVIVNTQEAHTSFGGIILRRWGFTEDYARISLLHEGPNYSDTTDNAVLVINLANNISRNIGYSLTDQEVDLSLLDSAKRLEIEPNMLEDISEETEKLMHETENIF